MTEATEISQKELNDMRAMIAATQVQNQNAQAMQQIVSQLREVPQLPSEVPKDIQPLSRVEFPEGGGVHTYMEGFTHPYKGFPFFESVEKIDAIKKIQRAALSSMYHSFKKRPWWQKAFLITVPWIFTDLIRAYIYSFHRMIDRFKTKRERYCTAVREVHRAFSIEWHDEKDGDKEMRLMLRDILCMFLEYDNAYRFRFQDIVAELNKENLKKDTAGEIFRLLNLLQSREKTQEITDSWTLVKTFFKYALKLNPRAKRYIRGILGNLDLEKIALDPGDIEYCEKRVDYQFKFMTCRQQNITSDTAIPRKIEPSSSREPVQQRSGRLEPATVSS